MKPQQQSPPKGGKAPQSRPKGATTRQSPAKGGAAPRPRPDADAMRAAPPQGGTAGRFPPKGSVTRKVFVGIVVALAGAMVAGAVFGPVLVSADGVGPRPFAPLLAAVTAGAMVAAVGWMVWMVYFRRR